MSKNDEMILCVPHVDLDGFTTRRDLFNPQEARFLRRGDVETDSSWHQIIPYVVVLNIIEGHDCSGSGFHQEILAYKRGRSGGEERLHDLYSIGIGGHINKDDYTPEDFGEVINNAIERELKEELGLNMTKDIFFVNKVGWFADSSTEVNNVHLGFLVVAYLKEDTNIIPEKNVINNIDFMEVEKIRGLNLEPWSKIALEVILDRA